VGSAKREEEKIMKQEEDNPKGSHRKEWGFVKRQKNFGKREEANMKLEEQMTNVKPEGEMTNVEPEEEMTNVKPEEEMINVKLEEQIVNVKPEEFNQTMATHIGKEDNRKHVWVKETE
jgi:hypothetical protein